MRYILWIILIALPLQAGADSSDKINRNVEEAVINQQRHRWDGWCRDARGAYVQNDQQRTPSTATTPPDCPAR